MSAQPVRWARYGDPEPPVDPQRLADAWVTEYRYTQAHGATDADSPEDDDWVTPSERLSSLILRDYKTAWSVALLILEQVPEDGLREVGHEVVRDIVRAGWPTFMPTVEKEAGQNERLRSALRGAVCCSSFASEVLQKVGQSATVRHESRSARWSVMAPIHEKGAAEQGVGADELTKADLNGTWRHSVPPRAG